MCDGFLKDENPYGYNDGSSLNGSTYRPSGDDDDEDPEPTSYSSPTYDEDEYEQEM